MDFLWVGVGGFLGAISRYAIYLAEKGLSTSSFPFGTLVINLSGCLVAGIFLAISERSLILSRPMMLLMTMGFTGAFTTFSTFSVETFQLLKDNQILFAIINILTNVLLGLFCVGISRWLILRV